MLIIALQELIKVFSSLCSKKRPRQTAIADFFDSMNGFGAPSEKSALVRVLAAFAGFCAPDCFILVNNQMISMISCQLQITDINQLLIDGMKLDERC